MANTYYDPGARRGEKVKDLFARIAPRYDLINDLQSFGLHRRWKRRVVELAKPQPGERALDVCCGTGDIALALSRCALEQVIGLDFSDPMLAVARRRTAARDSAAWPDGVRPSKVFTSETAETGQSSSAVKPLALEPSSPPILPWAANKRVVFLQGDAQQLPFPDDSFDIVTVGYGLRNLADWQTGLKEMCRVAKPGGRLLVLDFGKPDNSVVRALYYTYLRAFVPLLGLLFCGSPSAYAYILESLRHYPAQRGVARAMQELGLTEWKVFDFLGGIMSINYGVKAQRGIAATKV